MKDAGTGKKFGLNLKIFTTNAGAAARYEERFFQPYFWDALR